MIRHGSGFFSSIKYVVYSLLPLVILLAFLEGLLTFLNLGQPFQGTLRMWGAPMEMLEADEFTIQRPKPNFRKSVVALNSLGCRDDEFNTKADLKILTLGDSVDFGWGLPDYRDTYSEQLEAMLAGRLAKKQLTVDVLNGGVPSYKLYQGFQLYLHYLARITNWDVVIISFGWNEPLEDDEELEFIRRQQPRMPWTIQQLSRQAHRLRSYNALESTYLRYKAKPGGGREEVIYEEYKSLLKDMVQSIRAMGARVVLLSIQPRQEDLGDSAEISMARFNRIQKAQAVPGEVMYVDTNPQFVREQPGFYDNVHFDARGHRITAEALYQAITKELNL